MYCNKCGNEIPDDSNFCPVCGNQLKGETINVNKKATFKDGTVALFNKLFLFEGRSSRSEFNFGYLFLIIISSVISMFTISSELSGLLLNAGSEEALYQILNEYMSSKDILSTFNLYNIAVSLVIAIFLSAPVFRRLTDCGYNKNVVIVLTVLFVVSQILCSNLLWCLLPIGTYNSLSFIFEILSYVNLFVIIVCVFRKSAQ